MATQLTADNIGITNTHGDFNIDIDELNENNDKAVQPINIKVTLKPHQLTLLQRCIDYENNPQKLKDYVKLSGVVTSEDFFTTRMGIIADRVGGGKSYVILSIILMNNIMNRDNTIVKSSGLNNITFHVKDNKDEVKTNLLVIPHNLCGQWDKYVTNFSDTLKYKLVNKTRVIESLIEDDFNIQDYDLLIVTATFYNRILQLINRKNVKLQRIIFDEADSLNIPGCSKPEANFFWFVTASYGNTLYPKGYHKYDSRMGRYVWYANGLKTSGFIKNIFSDLNNSIPKDFIKVLMIKNTEAYVETSLSLPEVNSNIILCKTPVTINILNGIVDNNLITCLNAGDILAAMNYINPNNKGSEDNIINLLLDKYTKQITNITIRINMELDYIYDNERDREIELTTLNKKLDELKNKMQLITDRVKNTDTCSICYDNIENKTIIKCCQNAFCFECINIWLSKKALCPLCKSSLVSTDIYVVSSDQASTSNTIVQTAPDPNEFSNEFDKKTNFEILMRKKKGTNAKILIFSEYDFTFMNIITTLTELGIRYDYIKGNVNQCNCIINRYKGTELDVLLVNTRKYGSGMNLENTTDVIMFHKLSNQSESQVIGRAQRFGRTTPLNIYYLLHENEIATSN